MARWQAPSHAKDAKITISDHYGLGRQMSDRFQSKRCSLTVSRPVRPQRQSRLHVCNTTRRISGQCEGAC